MTLAPERFAAFLSTDPFPLTPFPPTEETIMNVQPYLSFEGRAQEALDFYKSALGATIAFTKALRVRMSDGFRSSHTMSTMRLPVS